MNMNIQFQEQRRHERVLRSDRVSFRVYPKSGCPEAVRRESAGRTGDLSESGACIVTDTQLPVGAALELRITITHPPTIFTRPGTVRWSRQSKDDGVWRAGIEFKPTASPADEAWRQFVGELRAADPARVNAA